MPERNASQFELRANDTAFGPITAGFYDRLVRIAARLVGQGDQRLLRDADDERGLAIEMATKGALAVLARFGQGPSEPGPVMAYAVTSMRNHMIDRLRKLAVRHACNLSVSDETEHADGHEPGGVDQEPDVSTLDAEDRLLSHLEAKRLRETLVLSLTDLLSLQPATREVIRQHIVDVVDGVLPYAERGTFIAAIQPALRQETQSARRKHAVATLLKMLDASGEEIAAVLDLQRGSAGAYVMRGRNDIARLWGVDRNDGHRSPESSITRRAPRIRLRYLLRDGGARLSKTDLRALHTNPAPSAERLELARRAALGDARVARQLLTTPIFVSAIASMRKAALASCGC